jgi:hypothetical protein
MNEFYRQNFISLDLIEIYLPDASGNAATLYLASGGMDITWNGNSYKAQGDFLGFSTVSEDFDVKLGKFQIYLSALGSNYIKKFLGPVGETTGQATVGIDYEGRRVIIRKVFLDVNTMAIIDDTAPIIFDGVIYNVTITETKVTASITIECSTLWADFERSAGRKTTNGSNWLYQGSTADTAFEKAGFIGETTELKWGRV